MTSGRIEVEVGDVSDMVAQLRAIYIGPASTDRSEVANEVSLSGTVRGPYCESARTLPATFTFEQLATESAKIVAQAAIADPCIWSPELPHVYQVDVVARQYGEIAAEFHGQIGINRTSPRRAYDFSTS